MSFSPFSSNFQFFKINLEEIGAYIHNKYTKYDTKNNLIRKLLGIKIVPRLIYAIEKSRAY